MRVLAIILLISFTSCSYLSKPIPVKRAKTTKIRLENCKPDMGCEIVEDK